MTPTPRWRELLEDRLAEAAGVLGAVPGVHGIVVVGSLGRGEPWPLSDIDLLACTAGPQVAGRVERRRCGLVDWWAASGHAQTLDVVPFTVAELRAAAGRGPQGMAERMTDARWAHTMDKAYGGHPAAAGGRFAAQFADWATRTRFHPAVVAARRRHWRRAAERTSALAASLCAADPARATRLLREAARALRLCWVEQWGERLGSVGREWTRFERIAARHGAREPAAVLAALAGACPEAAARRLPAAPAWLRERIDLAYRARRLVGEDVTAEENARDQLAAFTVHVLCRRPDLEGPWTGTPDPALGRHLAAFRRLLARRV
ncbi:nucleotidyltransferase domain-containing protein [Streptomyces sp. YIM 98790]|uniref:nucleotidyltransferase domain-containing protein n=1 Tax=Streptomyces sp. YIM 98790 TaxID=2689077 RepID=UPI0014095E36|nr:nucleotidyltransferase domain-containing protein [Streptomyces sp. YIM 98790]